MAPRTKENDIPQPETDAKGEFYTPDGNLKITSGFKIYPTDRDIAIKNANLWLEAKKKDDDVGDLWRVHDKLYDLTDFVEKHPGGKFWLEATRGADITEAFEASHINPMVEEVLAKYYVKDATKPRISPYTFNKNGFYKTIKAKAWSILKEDGRKPKMDMYLMQDSMLAFFLFFCFMGAMTKSAACIVISSVFLAFAAATAHNFFHQRDSWRMYIFDLTMGSSRDWRISHALSHHNYPNTIHDFEISMFEPLFEVLAKKNKSLLQRFGTVVPGFLWLLLGFHMEAIQRYVLLAQGKIRFHWTYTIVFVQLFLMCVVSLSIIDGLWLWLLLHLCQSIIFMQIGITAAHHHPEVYHEGDVALKDKDFGLAQVIATRDRGVVMTNLFLTSISFGNHTLHHLFPTVDHSQLPRLIPMLLETCQEFGVKFTLVTPWDMFKGFYQLMAKVEPNNKHTTLIKESKD